MNRHAGGIDAEFGGTRYTLCLTLGALSELEAAFSASDLVGLARRFEEGLVSARDVVKLIGCGLRGGGHALSDAEVAALSISGGLAGYIDVATRLIAATFGPFSEGRGAPTQKRASHRRATSG